MDSYHPISISPVPSKIVVKDLLEKFQHCLNRFNIMGPEQFGLRKVLAAGRPSLPKNKLVRWSDAMNCRTTYSEAILQLPKPMDASCKASSFGSELQTARVQILPVIIALFISPVELLLYRLFPLFCFIKPPYRPVTHGANK
ncbi:hypothetical protein J6590_056945 [Homalodisca vitripennis]|nr:hypothetical protein J6590_056945 [Homalodisca vitripennis]